MLMTLAQLEWAPSLWLAPLSQQWWQETVCSMLVAASLAVLGCFVVLRRMALIGDALSHAVLPGVIIAFIITQSSVVWGLLLGAAIAGLTTTVLINLISRYSRTKEDSAIGIAFTALFAIGLILISNLPRGTHFDLQCFIFGDPLGAGSADLVMMAVICPIVIAIVALLYHRLKLTSFDPVVAAAMGISVALFHYLIMGLLSLTVVAGLRTTGVILVVAALITPASAAYQLTNRLWVMLVLAGFFGALSALLGMVAAFVANAPAGPSMVLAAVAIFAVTVLLSPSHGLIFERCRKWKLNRHIHGEDVLKAMYRLGGSAPSSAMATIAGEAGLTVGRAAQMVDRLEQKHYVKHDGQRFELTDAGRQHAQAIVRAHRLWETYLGDEAGMDSDQMHDEAERLEHAHDLAPELDETLGRPTLDPHGSEIPRGA